MFRFKPFPYRNYLLILFDLSIYLYKRGVLHYKIKLIFKSPKKMEEKRELFETFLLLFKKIDELSKEVEDLKIKIEKNNGK